MQISIQDCSHLKFLTGPRILKIIQKNMFRTDLVLSFVYGYFLSWTTVEQRGSPAV